VLTWVGGGACDGVLPAPRPGAVGLTLRWVAWPLQDLAGLQDVLRRIGELEAAALAHELREVAALEVLDNHVGRAALEDAGVEHAGDVHALDAHRGAGLPVEAGDDVRARGDLGQEELEGDALAEGRGVPAHGVARGSAIRCRFGMLADRGAACFTRLPSSGFAQQRNPT